MAATITFTGAGNAPGLLLVRLTVSPPAGAIPVSTTVPVTICPETALVGLKESIVTTGASTVSAADMKVPLGSVAVMFAFALAVTASVVTLNVPLVAPAAMFKLAGTVAAPVLLLISVTVKPAGAAGPLRTTVPTEPVPPVTEFGLSVNAVMTAGLTVKVALLLLATSVAVTVAIFAVATPTVVAVKVCDVLPAGIITLAGTVTDGSELLKETVIPPVGAAWVIVTVPVELVPPVTVAGLKLTPVTVNEDTIVTFPITVIKPVVAITVTGVELPIAPAVTTKV